ncbi:granzyme A-like isoform X2 [Hyperolius riggenbachi]|uniref:granzyme A-like isoform X2 n=1 Tax=Hyperolius riggenbachi TaxID=752182 RepID=UPI0035A38246
MDYRRLEKGPDLCMEIIGGSEAIPHSWPFIAYISTPGNHGPELCGGTLINQSWVLTAAHCTIKDTTTIKLGLHSLSKEDEFVQTFQVSNWHRHPHYNRVTFDNDVQLVQLSGKAKLTTGVKPRKLPTTFSDVEPGTICESAGWGITSNDSNSGSDKLLEVNLPAISREKCAAMWKLHKITKNMMCTLDALGGKTTCNGDSGGPLICQGQLRGVVSFGPKNNCGNAEYPPGFAFLNENIVNWITGGIKNVNWIKREMIKK